MWTANLLGGTIMLFFGLVIRVFKLSNLIAGYNTASKEEKSKYSEEKLTKYVGNILIIASVILLIGGFLAAYSNMRIYIIAISWVLNSLVIIGGVVYVNTGEHVFRERHNKNFERNIASENSINILKRWVSENIAQDIWLEDYEKFLKVQNGFEFNGVTFYGMTDCENNLISKNEAWDWQGESFEHRYLFLGDTDISWYVFDIKEYCFEELYKPSGDLMQKFKDFDNMLQSALQSRRQI